MLLTQRLCYTTGSDTHRVDCHMHFSRLYHESERTEPDIQDGPDQDGHLSNRVVAVSGNDVIGYQPHRPT